MISKGVNIKTWSTKQLKAPFPQSLLNSKLVIAQGAQELACDWRKNLWSDPNQGEKVLDFEVLSDGQQSFLSTLASKTFEWEAEGAEGAMEITAWLMDWSAKWLYLEPASSTL